MKRCITFVIAAVLSAASLNGALAQNAPQGKPLTLQVGAGPGGAFDTYARVFAKHFPDHVPGHPNIIVQNVPGASGRRMMNDIYATAPKDGSVIGTGHGALAFDSLLDSNSKFRGADFAWIGSSAKGAPICFVWNGSPIQSINDATHITVTVGSTGPDSEDSIYPKLLKTVLGLNFKVIEGYGSYAEISKAIEGGELDGRCGDSLVTLRSLNMDWLQGHKIRFLIEFADRTQPELGSTPNLTQFKQTNEQHEILEFWSDMIQMGQPYFLPPGTPASVVDMYRHAFDETLRDQSFIDDASKARIATTGSSGKQIEALVKKVYSLPAEIIKKAATAAR